jgi:hypothetical protein
VLFLVIIRLIGMIPLRHDENTCFPDVFMVGGNAVLEKLENKIHRKDCLNFMRRLPDNSIDWQEKGWNRSLAEIHGKMALYDKSIRMRINLPGQRRVKLLRIRTNPSPPRQKNSKKRSRLFRQSPIPGSPQWFPKLSSG